MTLKKRTVISFVIFAVLFAALLVTATFTDLQVSRILTKGTLRGGGDTKFLMVADIIFLWVFSIPLGAITGLLLKWPGFWVYIALKIDQFLKCILCVQRLRSGKWIKKINPKESIDK